MGKTGKEIKLIFKKNWQEIILGLSAIIYFIYFSTASILKYNNFYTGRFDLGNMTQTVWNSLHGNLFMLTNPNGVNEVSRLAFHADFILVLLAPFYLIWEDPRTLLLIQSFVLSFGGIFVYLISNRVLKNKSLSLVFAICFFLNPAVQYTNLFDFHAVTLATTFLLGAFYFMISKKWISMVIFLILAGITKEQVWGVTLLFGLYLIFISKQKILGVLVSIFSLIIFYLLFWHLIPLAAGDEHFALEFYSDFGDSPGEVIKNIITSPFKTLQILTLPDRFNYLGQLFMPLGFASLVAFPFLIFASPDLFISLLSDSPQMHQIYYQYSATITPFIFIAAIYTVFFILKKIPELPVLLISLILLSFTFASVLDYGPLPIAKKPNNAWFKNPLENSTVIDNYIRSIPDNLHVSASNSLGSHLSHRKYIYVVPMGIDKSDMVLLLNRKPTENEKVIFKEMLNNPDFEMIFKDGDFYVFKRISS